MPMILSMDPLKLMLSSYNFLVAIDLSHQPVAILLATPILVVVILTLTWVNVVSDLWLQRTLLLSQSLPRSWLFLIHIISPLKSWFQIPHPLFSFRLTFSFISSLKFSVHGSAPISYNPPPPLSHLFLEEFRFHVLVL